jgi:hypothetical protein
LFSVVVALPRFMSALPPKADIRHREWNVRFGPKADIGSFDQLVGAPD